MSVAVFPIPELIDHTKNQPQPFDLIADVSLRWASPILPFVLTMQKMKSPKIAGSITIALNQKNFRSWYGRKNVNGRCISQKRKNASIPALVMPTLFGMVF